MADTKQTEAGRYINTIIEYQADTLKKYKDNVYTIKNINKIAQSSGKTFSENCRCKFKIESAKEQGFYYVIFKAVEVCDSCRPVFSTNFDHFVRAIDDDNLQKETFETFKNKVEKEKIQNPDTEGSCNCWQLDYLCDYCNAQRKKEKENGI